MPATKTTRARPGMVVIVEPGAGSVPGGHMRDKLAVFVRRLEERGIAYHIFTWLPAVEKYPAVTVVSESPAARWLRFVPHRFYNKALECLTYRAAFRFAMAEGAPVMGLTVSSPLALMFARVGLAFDVPFVQRLLYVGLHGSGDDLRVRKSIMGALQLALGENGTVIFTTAFQNEKFVEHQPLKRNPPTASCQIPEFILYDVKTSTSRDRANVLIVAGQDNHRRNPVQTLREAGLDRAFAKILLHMPAAPTRDEKAIAALQDSADEVVWTDDYIIADALLARFAQAKYSLVAYAPFFAQTSSIALQSVLCGLPILASRFPDSEYLAQRFGKIGEFFEYGNLPSFREALSRLLAWTDGDWEAFLQARRKMIAYCGYDHGVDRCLEMMGFGPAEDGA